MSPSSPGHEISGTGVADEDVKAAPLLARIGEVTLCDGDCDAKALDCALDCTIGGTE